MKLSDFYDELEKFDWFYYMSDDRAVFNRGSQRSAKISEIAAESERHQKLYKDYEDYVFGGPTWKADKKEKPPRPKED